MTPGHPNKIMLPASRSWLSYLRGAGRIESDQILTLPGQLSSQEEDGLWFRLRRQSAGARPWYFWVRPTSVNTSCTEANIMNT